ncbi:hypothetical protein [Bifidobacterium dentium]|uniref:hypothetical protein n=1 Tax=Bifidobacterium dentium TaxID=1689 RepID=UPI0018C1D82C|nr:hypothetical protein [Bifidobacterium dentium]MBF9708504.1 hypothetical protein [Bifidobacterium dentium]
MAGGSELGSAHVSIFPQMKGFRQNVANETGKAVSDMKNSFSKGFNAGFTDGVKELNAQALQSFKKDVAQASQKNTDALLKFKAAGVQVQAAQEKLNAVTQKYGADSTQAQAAAIKLEQAQLKQKAAADNLKTASDNLKAAQGRLKDLETQLAAESDKSKNAFTRMASGFASTAQQIVGKVPGVNAAVQKISTTAGEVTSAVRSKFQTAWNALPEGARNAAAKAGNALCTGLSKASGVASRAVSGIGKAAQSMATVISGAVAAAGAYLVNFGRQSVDAALKAGEVTAKFQQVAKNNNWTDEEQKSLLGLNKTLGQTGVVSGGTLKAAQAQLGTFALTADQVKTLTPALADMIANSKGYNATAQDGVQIANLLGKVMTGSATALSKYGVTMTDAQKKVLQEGSASEKAAMAAQVLEANFGGINKALANTPQGKMTVLQHEIAGLKTSVGNDLIAAFGGVGGAVIKMVQAVEPLITAFFDKVAALAEKIGPPLEKVFGTIADRIGKLNFNGFTGQLSSLSGPIAAVTGLLGAAGLGGALNGLSGIPVIGGLLSKFGGILKGLGGPITLVIGALAGLIATSPQLRSEFGTMLTGVFTSLQAAFQMLQPSIQTLMGALNQLVQAVMPVITNVIGQIIPMLTPIISTLVGALVPAIQGILTVVTAVVQALIPAVQGVEPIVTATITAIMLVIQALMPVISQISSLITDVVAAITPVVQGLEPLVTTVVQAISGVIQALVPVIQALAPLVSDIISAIVGFIRSTLLPAIQAMLPFIQGIINGITMVVNGIVSVIQGVINLVTGLINGNWSQAFNGFKQIVYGAVQGVLGFLGGIGSAIGRIFTGAGSWLWNAGKSILTGLLNGLKSAWRSVTSFVGGIGSWIVKHKGPISYDRRMLVPAGKAIMGGFDKSLKAGWKDVQRTVNGMNAQIHGGFDGDMSKTGRTNVSTGVGGNTFVTQTFNYPAIAPTSISTQKKLQTAAMPQW